jgi:hypothetical protein
MKYVVIELQTDANGNVANIITEHNTINEAEAKFYTILAAAAVSSVPCHTAVILSNTGETHGTKCYEH